MKKLLILHPYLAPYRLDLYNRLCEDYDVLVFIYGGKKEKASLGFDLTSLRQNAHFRFIEKETGLYVGRHLVSCVYISILKDFKPDYVLSHELGVNTLVMNWLKKLFGFKHLITVDDSLAMAQNYGKKREILRSYVYRRVDGICVVNKKVESYLISVYEDLKLRTFVLPIIQNDELLSAKIQSSRTLAEQYSTDYALKGKKVILFVARMIPIKRPMLLFEEFAKAGYKDCVLVFVGGGEELTALKKKMSETATSNVIITGPLYGKDLYAWYYIADLFVLPSEKEPFGAVVNEALVAGCKVLISDAAGASELVNDANGLVFNSRSTEDFAKKLSLSVAGIENKKEHQSIMPFTFDALYGSFTKFLES